MCQIGSCITQGANMRHKVMTGMVGTLVDK